MPQKLHNSAGAAKQRAAKPPSWMASSPPHRRIWAF